MQALLELAPIVQTGERIAHRLQIKIQLAHHLPRKNALLLDRGERGRIAPQKRDDLVRITT